MKLYYLPGASSMLPHIVLVEAGLTFDAIKVDEQTKTLQDGGDYRMVNPLGYVPALQLDDGTVLTEAAAIAQYVADLAPAKNLAPPNGTLDRVKLQSWLNFISSEVQLGCFCPLFDREFPHAVKAIFRRRLNSRLAHVEQHLAGNTYLARRRLFDRRCVSVRRFQLGTPSKSRSVPISSPAGPSQARARASLGAGRHETRKYDLVTLSPRSAAWLQWLASAPQW